MSVVDTAVKGGAWLIEEAPLSSVFTREKLTDEQRLIAQTADEFVSNEVLPALDRLEQKDWALARQLVERCGALGLLGTDVPEALGGVELDSFVRTINAVRPGLIRVDADEAT